MKRLITAVLALLLTASVAFTVPRAITFSFNGPTPDHYTLYMDGEAILNLPTIEFEQTFEIAVPEGRHLFTLTAVYPNGDESPHSEAYNYYVIDSKPVIVIIQ
jgi:hypothetical protein